MQIDTTRVQYKKGGMEVAIITALTPLCQDRIKRAIIPAIEPLKRQPHYISYYNATT